MNTLTLLPRKTFIITLDDGTEIKGQYSTWALKRFCDHLNCTLSQLFEKLKEPTLDIMFMYILSALEYSARIEKKPFSYTDVNISQWIDDMEGNAIDNLVVIFNHSADQDLNEEKKSLTEGSNQNGQTSRESITVQEDLPMISGDQQ